MDFVYLKNNINFSENGENVKTIVKTGEINLIISGTAHDSYKAYFDRQRMR